MSPPSTQKPRLSFAGLGIRTSLFLGFGSMCAVMLLATSIALFGTTQVSESLSVILNERLPATVITLRMSRATDALVATGALLSSVATEADRKTAFQRVDKTVESLQHSLADLSGITRNSNDVWALVDELIDNLKKMCDIVDQRIDLEQNRQLGRERLLSNLQDFKQHLTYRVRILEGDNAVINRLLSRPSPPMHRIVEMARRSARLTPVSRFYTEVETITGRVLAAIQDPTLVELQLSRQILLTALDEAGITFNKMPTDIASDLSQSFKELQELVLAENSVLVLREHTLMLGIESRSLNHENQRISRLVDAATSDLVRGGLEAMAMAGRSANETRQRYVLILLSVTAIGLLGIAALMHFHVMRHVVLRLSWLSEAMQNVAGGRFDTPLPPAGNDELGRLGFAVRLFQKTAIDADQREAELRINNQQLERARIDLEQKACELELANNMLEKLSVTDFLTGLANRRHFDEVLGSEWARAGRAFEPLALIMIDIDHFKEFNDRYGHQAGDECLKKVAFVLKENLGRAGDLVARYGGEEFVVISAYTDLSKAQALAEKIRRSVEDLALVHEDSTFGIITISLGIAVDIPVKTQSASDLVRAADTALYEAKADGRNCIKYQSVS